MIWERSRPSGTSERAATPKHMKTPREARVFTITCTFVMPRRRESALSDHYEDVLGMHNDMQEGQADIIRLLERKNAKLMAEYSDIQSRLHVNNAHDVLRELMEKINYNFSRIYEARLNLSDGFEVYAHYMRTGRF